MRCGRCGQENPAGMRFCGACGTPLGEVGSLPVLGGEEPESQRRYLTVLFADLVDSTAIAEAMDPEDFGEALAAYHAAADRAVARFGGYVAQYQGDGVIAYFGYPRAHQDDPQRGVHAALALLGEVSALSEQLRTRLPAELAVRIGLHTGLAIAGAVGTGPARERHAAVGETLHIAARVQGLADPGSIVVTAATQELLGGHFATEPLGHSEVKGLSHEVELFRIVGGEAGGGALQAAAQPLLPMVNRNRELERLAAAWRQAVDGNGAIVHVSGEPGIGKTRIVHALRELVADEPGVVHILRCSPHHTSTVLYPVVRFLQEAAGLEHEPAEALPRTQALSQLLVAAGLDPGDALPLLANLLTSEEKGESRAPREARLALLQSLQTLLIGLPAPRPVLLVVEDLHWADPTTLELLERIAGALADARVALVVTYRTDFRPPWTRWLRAIEIDVGALAAEDVLALAKSAAHGALGEEELRGVERAAEGVPLYVEEMTRTLLADTAAGRPVSRVPTTLQGLLGERLDRLPALANVIDAAAVLGREFDRDLAEALSSLDRAGFRSAIAQLTAEDVVRPVEGSRSRLEFKHWLLQEAAYDRLLRSRRRALHAQTAELLLSHGPAGGDFEADRIAHHLSCAGEPARALAYWELAGKRALGQAAFLEAAEHFRNGLKALAEWRPGPDGDAERGELLADLGMALQAGLTPSADVREIYEQARAAYARDGAGAEQLVPVNRGEYMQRIGRAEYRDGLALGEELVALGRDAGRSEWVAEGSFAVGFAHMMIGDLDQARAEMEAAIELDALEPGRDILEAQADPGVAALGYLAPVLWKLGLVEAAFERSDLCLKLAEERGGSVTLGLALCLRCGLLMVAGHLPEFERSVEGARSYCAEHNIGYWRDFCTMWSTWLKGHAAEPAGHARLLAKQLDEYLDSGSRVGLPHLQSMLADLCLMAGMREDAFAALSEASEHIDRTDEHYYEPEVNWMLARASMSGERPDAAAADAAYEHAMRVSREQNARLSELRSATMLAGHRRRTHAPREDVLDRLESLYESFEGHPDLVDVRRARSVLVEADRRIGSSAGSVSGGIRTIADE